MRRVDLRWQETEGPPCKKPSRTGFGSRLIKLELAHELRGNVDLLYEPGGFKAAMNFPAETETAASDIALVRNAS